MRYACLMSGIFSRPNNKQINDTDGPVLNDDKCVHFLQWALPRLHLNWTGYRKVRAQVCKRIARRMSELGQSDIDAYRIYLQHDSCEWGVLEECCRVTISRFYRDRRFFEFLSEDVLPALARRARQRGDSVIRCWSAGCASGEEAYSLSLLWHMVLMRQFPGMELWLVASDIDGVLIQRAVTACYPFSSLKELPGVWRDDAFLRTDGEYCLREAYRNGPVFRREDILSASFEKPLDFILCRNLVFTYFDLEKQKAALDMFKANLAVRGALAIGAHESLPEGENGMIRWHARMPVFYKRTQKGQEGRCSE